MVERKDNGKAGLVKTYVLDCMLVEYINQCMMDSIDLEHARKNTTHIRTDELVQNAKTTEWNEFPFQFDYRSWNHSHPKHPFKNPDDETANTNMVEVKNRWAKTNLVSNHKTVQNCRGALSVYEFKNNENI